VLLLEIVVMVLEELVTLLVGQVLVLGLELVG